MTETYSKLFAAIFKKAAEDDISKVCSMICLELKNRLVPKEEIHAFIDKHKAEIESDIRRYVYEEALDYPDYGASRSIGNVQRTARKILKKF